MAEIKWILTCDDNCPESIKGSSIISMFCPQQCPNAYYEKEQVNTEVPDGG